MQPHANIVIIGAGIVGCSAAYHLAKLGWRDVLVLDQGPLFETGGSTSHAPGLVFQTTGAQTLCRMAQYAARLYTELRLDDQPCFFPVGSLEVAGSPERLHDLHRRAGWGRAWGLEAEVIGPHEARDRLPLLDASSIHGALAVRGDGIAKGVRACEAMARVAAEQGVTFQGRTVVTGFERSNGRFAAVVTDQGRITAEYVLLCAGIWGPAVARLAGVSVPLTPCQHQYVRTTPLALLAGETREVAHPILRHQDKALYARQVGDSYGVGSYQHEPLLVRPEAIRAHSSWRAATEDEARRSHGSLVPASALPRWDMPSVMPFTPEHFAQPWEDMCQVLPALRETDLVATMNGMFSFTPDGNPLVGEAPELGGFWLAEAVWVTHGGGVGKAVAELLSAGETEWDMRDCDAARFERHAHSRPYVQARGWSQYDEVYDILHPLQQLENPRPLRTSPFYPRQQALGAVFYEGRGWERPQWYEANARLNDGTLSVGALSVERSTSDVERSTLNAQRRGWEARGWSPISVFEHLATRERVALFDMTSLPRVDVTGPGAAKLLEHLTSSRVDRPVGSVVYTCMLNARGGIRSDVTVARLAEDRFQVGCNGPSDVAWLRKHLPADGSAQVRDIGPGTCCIGVWGPLARALVQPLTDADLSNATFPYFACRELFIGEVPVVALRVSYVGELGWELYTSADYGLRLWDLLWRAGEPLGVVAAGRAAFDALRVEKGYRLWGLDMHSEHTPFEAGLGFTVKLDKGEFRGREALVRAKADGPRRKLCCLTFDDPQHIVLGKEPVFADGQIAGYVTSAAFGASVGKSIAYAWLPAEHSTPGMSVEVEYFGTRYPATIAPDPLWDPKGARLRV